MDTTDFAGTIIPESGAAVLMRRASSTRLPGKALQNRLRLTEGCVAFTGIPAFDVLARFHEMSNKTLYVGGKAHPLRRHHCLMTA